MVEDESQERSLSEQPEQTRKQTIKSVNTAEKNSMFPLLPAIRVVVSSFPHFLSC